MKIKRLIINHLAVPLKNPLVTAQLYRTTSCNIILQIEFDNGIMGYGESTPRIYVTGETSKTVFKMISRYFLQTLKTSKIEQLSDVEEIVTELNKQVMASAGLFHGSALCAVELALLDGLGKLLGKSLCSVLGKPVRNEIKYSLGFPYISAAELPKCLQIISQYQPEYFKIKVGKSPAEDMKRVAQIRAHLGDDVKLRVDANCQWNMSTAVMMVSKLEKLGIDAVEQPLAKNDIQGLKELRKITPLKVVADESACSFSDIRMLIDEDACDSVNIKISKCGGLINSLKSAEYLYAANKSCVLGIHAAETGILEAAGRIFGALAKNACYFEGSLAAFIFDESIVRGISDFDRHCLASLPSMPGLGIMLKKEVLKKYTLEEVLL